MDAWRQGRSWRDGDVMSEKRYMWMDEGGAVYADPPRAALHPSAECECGPGWRLYRSEGEVALYHTIELDLKPCPICGAPWETRPHQYHDRKMFSAECKGCGITTIEHMSRWQLARAVNRRAE